MKRNYSIALLTAFISTTVLALDFSAGLPRDVEITGFLYTPFHLAKDFNNDGIDDLMYSGNYFFNSDTYTNIYTYMYTDTILYGDPTTPLDHAASMSVAINKDYSRAPIVDGDFNGDGYTDFFGGRNCAYTASGLNSRAIFLGGENGPTPTTCLQMRPSSELVDLTDTTIAADLLAVDFNNDGNLDTVARNRDINSYLILNTGMGDGNFTQQFINIEQPLYAAHYTCFRNRPCTRYYRVELMGTKMIDYDNDGDLDAVLYSAVDAKYPDGNLFVYENNGGLFNETPVIIPSLTPVNTCRYGLPCADYTYPDWYNAVVNPTVNPDIETIRNSLVYPQALGVITDVTGDGLDDFVVEDDSQIKVYFGNDTGGFNTTIDYSYVLDTTAKRMLSVGDFNGDGYRDIAIFDSAAINSGNSTSIILLTNITNAPVVDPAPAPVPAPAPAPTPTGGTPIDFAGTITAIGTDYIEMDGTLVYYNADTTIKFNDVSGFAVGLGVQGSGTEIDGVITATSLEVN